MCSQIPTIPEKSRPLRSVIATNRQTQIPSQPYSVNTKVDPAIEEEVEGLFRPSQESGDFQVTQANESEYQNYDVSDAQYDNHVRRVNNVNSTFQANNMNTVNRIQQVKPINHNSNHLSHKPYTDLVRVHDVLDSMYWQIIPYDYFNRIQSAVCDAILYSSENIVVSAPTVSIVPSPFSPGLWQNGSIRTRRAKTAPRMGHRPLDLPCCQLSLQHRVCLSHESALQRDLHEVEQHVRFARPQMRGKKRSIAAI